eukprot:COSAG01_NODE_25563_length_740_cov_114.759750_1_plen_94_part_01
MAVAAGARALPPTTHRVEAITQRGAAEAQPAHRDAGAGQRPAQHQRRRLLHALGGVQHLRAHKRPTSAPPISFLRPAPAAEAEAAMALTTSTSC